MVEAQDGACVVLAGLRERRPARLLARAHCARTSTRRVPSRPWGRAFIITIRIAPIMSCLVIEGSAASTVSQTNDAR